MLPAWLHGARSRPKAPRSWSARRGTLVSKGRLTRQELGWLLTQEAAGAAERLRMGVQVLKSNAPPPLASEPPGRRDARCARRRDAHALDDSQDALRACVAGGGASTWPPSSGRLRLRRGSRSNRAAAPRSTATRGSCGACCICSWATARRRLAPSPSDARATTSASRWCSGPTARRPRRQSARG